MTIGYRHRDSNGPLYHPERDFAYITPTLMKQAIEAMSSPHPEYAQWRAQHQIEEVEIVAAANALADAQRDFVSSADPVKDLATALHRYNYHTLRLPVRMLLQAAIGEVMIGAWFQGVREVTAVNEESPAQNEMCRFAAAVREFAVAQGVPTLNANSTAETLLMQNDILRGRVSTLHQECLALRRQLAVIEAEKRAQPTQRTWWDWLCKPRGLGVLPPRPKNRQKR